MKINNLKMLAKNGRTMYTHYPCHLSPKKISYEMTFTCISSQNSIHHNMFSHEKRIDKAGI